MSDKTESEQDQPLLFDAAVGELATLRKEVNEIVRQLLRGTGAREDGGASQAIRTDKTVVELLVEGGVSSQFAARILGVTEELAKRHRLVRSENPALRSDTSSGWSRVDVTRAIASMLPQPQGTPLPDTIQPRLVLAGAPGSGKTTVALKLAETFRSLTGRRVRVLAYQPDVGQSSNVPACGQVCIVRSLAGLAVACRRLNSDEPLIVDCCGFDSSNLEDAERFSRAIAEMPEFETHLVLPAFMKSIDARKALDLLEMLSPNRIVLNRLDEARTIGGVVEAVVMSGRPVSYLNGGKLGSTVIRRATAGALARRLVQSALRVRFAGQPLAAHPEF
jgi:flagellar biosynthesis GTPase FlhF